MRLRKLRIAWSVACGLACVLSILLWLGSYRWKIEFSALILPTQGIYVESLEGRIALHYYHSSDLRNWRSSRSMTPVADWMKQFNDPSYEFKVTGLGGGSLTHIAAPIWLMAAMLAALAVSPWIRWRFTLRTLLIATTLVAVALGLIVWLNHR